jgi:hypothetical protein
LVSSNISSSGTRKIKDEKAKYFEAYWQQETKRILTE